MNRGLAAAPTGDRVGRGWRGHGRNGGVRRSGAGVGGGFRRVTRCCRLVAGCWLGRVRAEMARYAVDACVLFDPVNIRYATDSRNMQIFTSRNPARYLFLPIDGPVVLFDALASL